MEAAAQRGRRTFQQQVGVASSRPFSRMRQNTTEIRGELDRNPFLSTAGAVYHWGSIPTPEVASDLGRSCGGSCILFCTGGAVYRDHERGLPKHRVGD